MKGYGYPRRAPGSPGGPNRGPARPLARAGAPGPDGFQTGHERAARARRPLYTRKITSLTCVLTACSPVGRSPSRRPARPAAAAHPGLDGFAVRPSRHRAAGPARCRGHRWPGVVPVTGPARHAR